jgi:hypothetical protein
MPAALATWPSSLADLVRLIVVRPTDRTDGPGTFERLETTPFAAEGAAAERGSKRRSVETRGCPYDIVQVPTQCVAGMSNPLNVDA